jgi:6-phosphogluconate dehydrogenase
VDTLEGFLYIDIGISGSGEDALKGPTIMLKSKEKSYLLVQGLFEKTSVKAMDNKPCVFYIGQHGAGHFVIMVHNRIEYVWDLKKVDG